jgi:ribosomal protein L37AE/L43A
MPDVTKYIQFCPVCVTPMVREGVDKWRCPDCKVVWQITPHVIEKDSPLTKEEPIKQGAKVQNFFPMKGQ